MAHVRNMRDLEQLYRRLPELAFEESRAFLTQLIRDPVFVVTQILPALSHVPPGTEPTIVASYGQPEASTRVQVLVWPAGAITPIHDHTSWGTYHCAVGTLLEERYQRLDDGAQPSRALLRKVWRRVWRYEDRPATVGAYEAGIHRMGNPGSRPALSVHLYGPRQGAFNSRDYDPARDLICEWREANEAIPAALNSPYHHKPAGGTLRRVSPMQRHRETHRADVGMPATW